MSTPKKRGLKKAKKRYKPGSFMDLYMAVGRYVSAQGGCVVVANGISTIRWPGESPANFTIGVRCTGRAPSCDTTPTDLCATVAKKGKL